MIEVLAKAIHHTTKFGSFNIYIVKGEENQEHVVLTRGDIKKGENILCRVSSECLPGLSLLSAECDCEEQVQFSLQKISEIEQGIFIYLRQEGRGHGLVTKIRALENKNNGYDTFTAVEQLGLPADIRTYAIVKSILDYFEIQSISCITNNPDKVRAFRNLNISISSVITTPVSANLISYRHLRAKQNRGHKINFAVSNKVIKSNIKRKYIRYLQPPRNVI